MEGTTIQELGGFVAVAILALSTFFEISPIKFNPISMFLGWLGKKLNRNMMERVEEIENKMDTLEHSIDDNEVYRLRYEILDFASSCQNQRRHSKEEFDHILDAFCRYENILEKNKKSNGQIEQAHQYITRLYQSCCDENAFL